MEKNLWSKRRIVEDSLVEYHKYRTDVVAKLISIDEKGFKIMFTGHFCEICGISDEYQLVLYFLEEKGLKSEINKIQKFDDEFIAEFKIIGQQ